MFTSLGLDGKLTKSGLFKGKSTTAHIGERGSASLFGGLGALPPEADEF